MIGIGAGLRHHTRNPIRTFTGTSIAIPTPYIAPFDTILVSGNSFQTVTVQSPQLFDKSKSVSGYIDNTDGTAKTTSYGNTASKLILISPSTAYKILGNAYTQPAGNVGLAWYGATGTYISGVNYGTTTGNGTYTSPSTAYYVRYTVNTADLNTSIFELGSSSNTNVTFTPQSPSSDYPAPITGTTKITVSDGVSNSQIISFPQSLYSLPNGTADNYDAVSKIKTQKAKQIVFDGSADEGWGLGVASNDTYKIFATSISAPFTIAQGVINQIQVISDKFPGIESKTAAVAYSGEGIGLNTDYAGQIRIWIRADRLTTPDAQGFKTWLASNPLTAIYQLATPQTITASRTQILCYKGTTHITSDNGSAITAKI